MDQYLQPDLCLHDHPFTFLETHTSKLDKSTWDKHLFLLTSLSRSRAISAPLSTYIHTRQVDDWWLAYTLLLASRHQATASCTTGQLGTVPVTFSEQWRWGSSQQKSQLVKTKTKKDKSIRSNNDLDVIFGTCLGIVVRVHKWWRAGWVCRLVWVCVHHNRPIVLRQNACESMCT